MTCKINFEAKQNCFGLRGYSQRHIYRNVTIFTVTVSKLTSLTSSIAGGRRRVETVAQVGGVHADRTVFSRAINKV